MLKSERIRFCFGVGDAKKKLMTYVRHVHLLSSVCYRLNLCISFGFFCKVFISLVSFRNVILDRYFLVFKNSNIISFILSEIIVNVQ